MNDTKTIERVPPHHQRTAKRNKALHAIKKQNPTNTMKRKSKTLYEAIKGLGGACAGELLECLGIGESETADCVTFLQAYGVTVICEQRPLLTPTGFDGVVDFYRLADTGV